MGNISRIEGIVLELLQMQGHALHAAADHVGVRLLDALRIPAQRYLRPKITECMDCLID